VWCEHEECACGAEFDAWFQAMLAEGYEGKVVYFNSQFALPTPQSRDRMYVMFWRIGIRPPNLDFRPVSWCSSCETIVRGVQHWKKPSRKSVRQLIFEWGRFSAQYTYVCPNEDCGEIVAPAVLGAKTIIDRSLPIERIGDKAPTYCNSCKTKHPVACNTRKRIKVGAENLGSRRPMQVQVGGNLFERPGKARVWSLDDSLRTVTGTSYMAVADLEGMILRCGGQAPAERDVGGPMSTITAHDRQIGYVTQTKPSEMVMQNMENNAARHVDEPTPPITTGGNHMLVQTNRGGDRAGKRAWSTEEPHPTVAGHGECALVEFRGEHGSMREPEVPAHTVTAEGTHHGLLVYNGVPGFVRELDDATGTITARDKQSLLVPYFRTGVARTVDEPTGTVTTHDREALVITDEDIDDCYLRMLQWEELLRAQVMHEHLDGKPYELTAKRRNKRGQLVELSNELRTKMIGNAVSSPVATMLGQAIVDVLRD
jgi:DNA (cytosine-5)-methyltransferase 1